MKRTRVNTMLMITIKSIMNPSKTAKDSTLFLSHEMRESLYWIEFTQKLDRQTYQDKVKSGFISGGQIRPDFGRGRGWIWYLVQSQKLCKVCKVFVKHFLMLV